MYNFNYHCPSSLQEAESLYAKSEDPMFLAGGHTLLPTMKQRLNAPTDLIDLAGLTELAGISREGDVLQIVLRTAIKAYTEPSMVTRLESALGQYYGNTVRLQMQFGEVQQTAHAVQSETRRQALDGAKQALQEDPFLKDIQNLMGATVVSGSERTLSNTGQADI